MTGTSSYPESDGIVKAVRDIIEANNDFREGMPADWGGDPLQDAIDAAAKLLLGVVQGAREPAAYSVDWTFKKSDPSFSAGGGSCVHWGSDKDDYKAHLEKLRGLDFVESITVTPLYAGPSVSSTQNSPPASLSSLPSGESDPSVTMDCAGGETVSSTDKSGAA